MKKVLFICLGNICRSPAAEAIFKAYVKKNSLDPLIQIDSAGTSDYHESEPADGRMRVFAKNRGYEITSLSRPFDATKDFSEFDYIITMDQRNLRDVLSHDREQKFRAKVRPMTDFCRIHSVDHVPDPYHQGDDGFELVLDILEDACEGLLSHVQNELQGVKKS